MEALPVFYLYSTLGCHLCEEALGVVEDLRLQMLKQFGVGVGTAEKAFFEVRVIDIADDDNLVARYGARIPVLLNESLSNSLFWPFDAQSLYQFMSSSENRC